MCKATGVVSNVCKCTDMNVSIFFWLYSIRLKYAPLLKYNKFTHKFTTSYMTLLLILKNEVNSRLVEKRETGCCCFVYGVSLNVNVWLNLVKSRGRLNTFLSQFDKTMSQSSSRWLTWNSLFARRKWKYFDKTCLKRSLCCYWHKNVLSQFW